MRTEQERRAYYREIGYRTWLEFSRLHIGGALDGMVTDDTMPFTDEESATSWVRDVNRYAKRNGYKVTTYKTSHI